MKLSYVLPDPASYGEWSEFEGDLDCLKRRGLRCRRAASCRSRPIRRGPRTPGLGPRGLHDAARSNRVRPMPPGATAFLRPTKMFGRERRAVLKSFVDLAARWQSVIVFGSLQGRLRDEPDETLAKRRIRAAIEEVGRYASDRGVVLAFEPVCHEEVGFHDTNCRGDRVGSGLGHGRRANDDRHVSHEHRGERTCAGVLPGPRSPGARPSVGNKPGRAGQRPLAHRRVLRGTWPRSTTKAIERGRLSHAGAAADEHRTLDGGASPVVGLWR